MTDLAPLDRLIAKLKRSRAFLERAAPAAAAAMADALRATASAGKSPSGVPWPERKKGGAPLVRAADKITVRAVGTTLLARIGFPESIHQKGTSRIPRRQILPVGGIPPAVSEAIKRALVEFWQSEQ